jgi:hypothetical protein
MNWRYVKIAVIFILFAAANLALYKFIRVAINETKNGEKPIAYGVTFSRIYAEELGLDWKKAYLAILDGLGVKEVRVPAYWNLIEKKDGDYSFTDLDWQISEAEKRDVKILLVIGRRLPRWPECFAPDWLKNQDEEIQREKLLKMIRLLVLRYRDNENIWAWQVENEPLLRVFGECPASDKKFLEKEIALVKSLDSRPVVITESGELSTWIGAGRRADIVGTSMYSVVWSPYWGYFHHRWPVSFYTFRAWIVEKILKKQVFVSEMQAEPWGQKPTYQMPVGEQFESMDLETFRKAVEYVKKTGLSPVYFWGAEWWYWLKEKQGHNEFWDESRELFR